MPVGDMPWEAHIGVFTSDIDRAMQRTLAPILAILGVRAIVGTGVFVILAPTVSGPIRKLCAAGVRISQGRLSKKIEASTSGEIGQLALALEAMRLSLSILRLVLATSTLADGRRSSATPSSWGDHMRGNG